MSKPFSEEFFYLDDDGKQQDAEIHEPILRGGAAPPFAREFAAQCGLTAEEITALFGDQT